MACSTTSTGDVLRSLHDQLQGKPTKKSLKYGINFRQVISRMMVQVLAKAYACGKWNKPMIWAVQDVLFRYMEATTKVTLPRLDLSNLKDQAQNFPILFFLYEMNEVGNGVRFELRLADVYGGKQEDFLKIFEPVKLTETPELIGFMESNFQNKDSFFKLSGTPLEVLRRLASKIALNDESENENNG